jgi:hypothetical protein
MLGFLGPGLGGGRPALRYRRLRREMADREFDSAGSGGNVLSQQPTRRVRTRGALQEQLSFGLLLLPRLR